GADRHGHDRDGPGQTRSRAAAGRCRSVRQAFPARGRWQGPRAAGENVMNEVIREFLIETHENLAQLDLDLVTLEKEPTERETLARAFRTLHTVKGTAGFLGLDKLQAVAHAAENLLSRLRDGELVFDPEIASALLRVVDAVRQMLQQVEASETDGDGNYTALIQTLERLRTGKGNAPPPPPPPPGEPAPAQPLTPTPLPQGARGKMETPLPSGERGGGEGADEKSRLP